MGLQKKYKLSSERFLKLFLDSYSNFELELFQRRTPHCILRHLSTEAFFELALERGRQVGLRFVKRALDRGSRPSTTNRRPENAALGATQVSLERVEYWGDFMRDAVETICVACAITG